MKTLLVFSLLCALTAFAAGEETIRAFPDIRKMQTGEAAAGRLVSLSGVVTFVRNDGFVLATSAERDQNAVFVVRIAQTAGPTEISEGDAIRVEGRTCVWENIAAVEAHSLVRSNSKRETLPSPDEPKWHDVRKGWRNLRRGSLRGTIAAADLIETEKDGHPVTILTLRNWDEKIGVHINGHIHPMIAQVGNTVEVVGIVRNAFDADGKVLASFFEVSSPDGVNLLATSHERLVEAFLIALGILAALAATGFCTAWLRALRERKEMKLLAADRRRIAADLHDTIEQHLAGARILLDGVAGISGIPDAAQKRIRMACEILGNAKAEVREAVTGLKSDISDFPALAAAIERIAEKVSRLGQVKAVADCKGLKTFGGSLHGDAHVNLLLIIRETVTNAIKHGKAKNIRIYADGLKMRIANDGAPFDPSSALGPETGHYGLSGMKERCARNNWNLSFGRDGVWTFVEVTREVKK